MQSFEPSKIDTAKPSRTAMLKRRVAELKEEVKTDTQKIRLKTMKQLEELFNMASEMAKGEIQYQTENGKPQRITISQRQRWARVAAYIAQIINGVATHFDEHQIDEDLAKLERLIDEAKTKTKTPPTGTSAG
ncbi:MAG: hypothetical protein QXU45_08545 [Candidatus Bathyarchaeia archaeon]